MIPLLQNSLLCLATILMAAEFGHYAVLWFLNQSGHPCVPEDKTARWIGYFERALIAAFVFLGMTAGTVFIFAVKAAVMGYRIPDDENKKRTAEYMLLGTMISYIIALLFGYIGVGLKSLLL